MGTGAAVAAVLCPPWPATTTTPRTIQQQGQGVTRGSRSSRVLGLHHRHGRQEQVHVRVRCAEKKQDLELACLPFSPAEVMVPGSTKSLHLYEARFLALLDAVLRRPDRLLSHILVQQQQQQQSMVASHACLCRVLGVKRLEMGGALVTVQGVARLSLVEVTKTQPFLQARVEALVDERPSDGDADLATGVAAEELKKTLAQVQYLQLKLRVRSLNEQMQTPLERAMQWAQQAPVPELEAAGLLPSASPEERLSFAALQPVSGASPADLHALLQQRLAAMECTDTLQRLTHAMQYALHSRASVAAKVALQSLQLT